MRCTLPLVALCLLLLPACGSDRPERPNVILIVMDTTRADRTSLHGYSRPTTPYLEKLAAESTVYDDAWSPSSWTGPAHASLFTGLRPERHGLYAGLRLYLDEHDETLAEILSGAGYSTACLTGNPTVSPQFGLVQGFAIYEDFAEIPGRPALGSQRATSRALQYVRQCRSRSRPYFLFINHFLPHLAYDPPAPTARAFLPDDARPEEIAAGRGFRPGARDIVGMIQKDFTDRHWSILSGLYDGEIATVDDEIARFVEILRAEGELDDTVLIIVGDHGENLGDHGLCAHVYSLHRSLLHVPLLIRYPDAFRPGARVRTIARLEDLFPTILSLCGAPVPKGLDGLSLLDPSVDRPARAVLGGEARPEVARDFPEFGASGIWRPRRSVYDGRYHFIVRTDGHEELYDVRKDPGELRNLAGRDAAVTSRLRALLPRDPLAD